jgi:hypothetical protein
MPQPEKEAPPPAPAPEPPPPPVPVAPPEPEPQPPPAPLVVEVPVEVTKRQLLYAGLRGGIQMRTYTPSVPGEDYDEDIVPDVLNVSSSAATEYEAAVFFGIQITNFLALQADFMWTSNDITVYDEETLPSARYQTSFGPMNLMIGAQLKFTFWLGKKVLLAPFGAFYASMLPSGVTYTKYDDANEDGADIPVQTAGVVINVGGGLTFGVKMGPGELFVEGKFLFDMTPTRLTSATDDADPVSWDAYTRSILPSITLGYQFRFGKLTTTNKEAVK